MQNPTNRKIKENLKPKKSKIPYFFFAFFAVIFLVNIGYIYISKKTWHGISIKDSYMKGLNYNETIKAAKEQEKLGWKLDINYNSLGQKQARIVLALRDKKSRLVKGAEMFVNFKNPQHEALDFSYPVKNEGGLYVVEVPFPAVGQWDMEVFISKGDDEFREVKRYVVR